MCPLFVYLAALFFLPASCVLADEQDKPFAVVELFSSEGCSSCPAADLLVSKLTAWARQNNKPVYPLIFHVDYWNGLGWRDTFSNPLFTQRQKEYAKVFRDQGVYTPEMIVNGSDAFAGADNDRLQKNLEQELAAQVNVSLNISLKKQGNQVLIKYSAEGFMDGDLINFALVERGLTTDVVTGENAGRTLHHDNVVREFRTKPISDVEGSLSMPLNKISDLTQASLIAYIQNPQTMLIEDAKQIDLAND